MYAITWLQNEIKKMEIQEKFEKMLKAEYGYDFDIIECAQRFRATLSEEDIEKPHHDVYELIDRAEYALDIIKKDFILNESARIRKKIIKEFNKYVALNSQIMSLSDDAKSETLSRWTQEIYDDSFSEQEKTNMNVRVEFGTVSEWMLNLIRTFKFEMQSISE
jgi:uncharacterized protein (DUF2344 family)